MALMSRFPEPLAIYNALKPLSASIDVWFTHYHHILEDHQAIVEWVKGTGLSAEHKEEFLARYRGRLEEGYLKLCDGKVMLRYP